MAALPPTLLLQSREEARRLFEAFREVRARAGEDLGALLAALDLGVRAAELMAVHRLLPATSRFPATIGMRLETPDAAVVPGRDAAQAPPVLGFADVLDLLSAEGLPCVSPALHGGWEDRAFSCRRSRATATGAAGLSLEAGPREPLLLLAAYRNRVFRLPPPVRVETAPLLEALPALESLYLGLSGPGGEPPPRGP